MCNDITIKELLPAYQEQALDQTEKLTVEDHLASCEDCRTELSLLRMMTEETVPDPGETFWAPMPDRIYEAVHKRKTKQKIFELSWLLDRITLPRWTWTAATMGTILLLSWFLITPVQKEPGAPPSQRFEFADESIPAGPMNVAELDHDELSVIDTWAGAELASIAHDAEKVLGNGQDNDMDEELAELNTRQAKQLLAMIDQQR